MGGENQNPNASEPVFEIDKDGNWKVDGKKVVLESDLIAAKKSLEGDLKTANENYNNTKLELDNANDSVRTLNEQLAEAKKARASGEISEEEFSRIKGELETAKNSVTSLTTQVERTLEYRKALIVATYGVAPETIKDKDMEQLDSFEEALKAVATVKGGPGPYALGGQGGETTLSGSPYANARKAYGAE